MKKYLDVILACMFILVLLGVGHVGPKRIKELGFQAEVMKAASGFHNPFPLLKIDEDKERLKGFLSGNFLLGCGSVEGKISQGGELTVWWEKSGEDIIRTLIPYEKIIFVVAENVEPTIEFVLYRKWTNLYKSLPENSNEVLQRSLKFAKITIHKQFFD